MPVFEVLINFMERFFFFSCDITAKLPVRNLLLHSSDFSRCV